MEPYLPDDPNNLPKSEARERFLSHLSEDGRILKRLQGTPRSLWRRLSDELKIDLGIHGWALLDTSAHVNPKVGAEEVIRYYLTLVPLHDALIRVAKQFFLLQEEKPVVWVMETLLSTISAVRPPKRLIYDHDFHLDYPVEGDVIGAGPAVELDFSGIVMVFEGKRADESWQVFERRVNHEFRQLRKAHLASSTDDDLRGTRRASLVFTAEPQRAGELKRTFVSRLNEAWRLQRRRYRADFGSDRWTTRQPITPKWIDELARWQLGESQRAIDPTNREVADRHDFLRRTKAAAEYLGISRRMVARGLRSTK